MPASGACRLYVVNRGTDHFVDLVIEHLCFPYRRPGLLVTIFRVPPSLSLSSMWPIFTGVYDPAVDPASSIARSLFRTLSTIIVTRETDRRHVSAMVPNIDVCAVPELTRNAGIQLNSRLLLRCHEDRVVICRRTISPTSGFSMAKPSGDHTPLGGFVLG
jgi:hypothetical protein